MSKKLNTYLFMIGSVAKVGASLKKVTRDIYNFYRGNVIRVFGEKGEDWFNFLAIPRTINEIAENYKYTDREFLQYVLDTLTEDETIIFNEETSKYQVIGEVEDKFTIPKVFNDSAVDVLSSFAKVIPQRLKGGAPSFSKGFQLFNWDVALGLKMYEIARGSTFKFSKALNYTGKFLDVGCGNGFGTTVIWSYYEKKKCFYPGTNMEIFGIDSDEGLLDIAKNEFELRLKTHLNYTKEQIESYRPYFPKKFELGSVTDIPFEDNTFDIIYISQVLHWTDPKVALKEIIRVAKPGSLIFGGQVLIPFANKYMDLHIKTIKGAHGFFTKEEFLRFITEAGGKNIKTATPVTCFTFTK
ncbi:MAG: class I SAM-dependent methyltransferase [Candidatus Lokiarchaeota archaeon]|nr:class I SAM-dependent methyltransferase [Candidatus Lokiarchaeota archaeon]